MMGIAEEYAPYRRVGWWALGIGGIQVQGRQVPISIDMQVAPLHVYIDYDLAVL